MLMCRHSIDDDKFTLNVCSMKIEYGMNQSDVLFCPKVKKKR